MRIPCKIAALLFVLLSPLVGQAIILYSTEFENFGPFLGDDKLVGTDGWLGTTSVPGRSGVAPEEDANGVEGHGVPGLGQAAYIGGNITPVTLTAPNTNIRRPLGSGSPQSYDPVASNTEVTLVTFQIGIKDSVAVGGFTLRDDFEVFFMNGAGKVLAALQFDNTTLNTQVIPPVPQQIILRTQSTAGVAAVNYTTTSSYYLYDVIQAITVRINWRTNRWTAFLDDSLLFNDLPFYLGTETKNLGAVGFRTLYGRVQQIAPNSYTCTGGTNYAIIDNLTVQANALTVPTMESITRTTGQSMKLVWPTEAGYTYKLWKSTALSSNFTTISTQTATVSTTQSYTDNANLLLPKAFYRVSWAYP